jgi:hypothetical protein
MASNSSLTLSEKLSSIGDVDYSDVTFRLLLEDHLPNIKLSDQATVLDVDPSESMHYKNNFYGLLSAMRIEQKYHWIIMRANGIENTLTFDGIMSKLLHPDLNMVDSLYSTWRTKYRVM